MADLEIWQNVSKGKRAVLKMDNFGKTVHELVGPNRTVTLSRDERLQYQRLAATVDLDIFQNGAMVPVKLIDEEDSREMADNPNLRGTSELTAMFKLPQRKFEAELAKIKNTIALERMIEMAEMSDDIPVKKYNTVVERLDEVKAGMTTQVTKVLAKSSEKNRDRQ